MRLRQPNTNTVDADRVKIILECPRCKKGTAVLCSGWHRGYTPARFFYYIKCSRVRACRARTPEFFDENKARTSWNSGRL